MSITDLIESQSGIKLINIIGATQKLIGQTVEFHQLIQQHHGRNHQKSWTTTYF